MRAPTTQRLSLPAGSSPDRKAVPSALDAALAAIEEDGVFALIHLVVEQRVKAY
jgi:hypothetical protein